MMTIKKGLEVLSGEQADLVESIFRLVTDVMDKAEPGEERQAAREACAKVFWPPVEEFFASPFYPGLGDPLRALALCFLLDVQPPLHVRAAFLQAMLPIMRREEGAWDGAFGRAHPKGARWRLEWDRKLLAGRVAASVHEAKNDGFDAGPDGLSLFEYVGQLHGIGKTQAEALYRWWTTGLRPKPRPAGKKRGRAANSVKLAGRIIRR